MVGLFCRDRWLATERPADIFIWFVHSTRIFLAKAVYMVLGCYSYLSARKILALGTNATHPFNINQMQKTYGARWSTFSGSSWYRIFLPPCKQPHSLSIKTCFKEIWLMLIHTAFFATCSWLLKTISRPLGARFSKVQWTSRTRSQNRNLKNCGVDSIPLFCKLRFLLSCRDF